jgi:hypothetical protein
MCLPSIYTSCPSFEAFGQFSYSSLTTSLVKDEYGDPGSITKITLIRVGQDLEESFTHIATIN